MMNGQMLELQETTEKATHEKEDLLQEVFLFPHVSLSMLIPSFEPQK